MDNKEALLQEFANKTQVCPSCGQFGKFIPPPKIDNAKRLLIVTFKCTNNHIFRKELELK